MQKTPPLLFILAIALISACVIALELALMRYLLIAFWHHLYYLVISAALLGFGASGTFLCFIREWIQKRCEFFCWLFALLFALSAAVSFHVLSIIPLNMMHLAWNFGQVGYLILQYIILFVPFFLGACCLGAAFIARASSIGTLYAANMIGSGLGAAAGVGLMYVADGAWLAVVIGAALCLSSSLWARNRRQLAISMISAVLVFVVLAIWSPPQQLVSQYKALSYYRQLHDAEILAHRHSPLGRIDVVRSSQIHVLPGRSLTGTAPIPPQTALIIDGDSVSAMTRFDDPGALAGFDETTLAVPYHVLPRPVTLIFGAGGGFDIGLALYHQCREITALEINPQVIELVREEFAEQAGHVYSYPSVQVVEADARAFLRQSIKQFDLIQIPPLDSFSSTAAGVHALNESYLYTIEALQLYLKRLQPNGVLCLTRWVRYWPGRDGIKLLATAIEAAEQNGLKPAGQHLIAIRSWATITVMLSPSPFTNEQIQAVLDFCRRRQFDLVYYPGITAGEVNRYHVLQSSTALTAADPQAVYYEAALQLLDPQRRQEFYRDNLCQVMPATDDRPYFHDFFRRQSLPKLRRVLGNNWIPFIDWGYLILFAALVQSCLMAFLCILLPLFWLRRGYQTRGHTLTTLLYFSVIGLAYMMLEISFIQRLALFLSHPVATVAVVLGGFLCFSGGGSFYARRYNLNPRQAIIKAGLGIGIMGILYLLLWDQIIMLFQAWPWIGRCLVSLVLLAPLAFFMGMPFPMGLLQLSRTAPNLTPWAWGVNGFASVIAASLTVCLAISLGHSAVLLMAVGLYLLMALFVGVRHNSQPAGNAANT